MSDAPRIETSQSSAGAVPADPLHPPGQIPVKIESKPKLAEPAKQFTKAGDDKTSAKEKEERQEAVLGTELSKMVQNTSIDLLKNMQTRVWEVKEDKGIDKIVNRLKRMLGPVFGIGYGIKNPAQLVGATLQEQAFHMGKEALGVGVAAGGIAAGVQIATDAIRALKFKENHRHLLTRTLMRTTGGPEAWMMRHLALGNRSHMDKLQEWGQQIQQGTFTKEYAERHHKSITRTLMSSYDAMAGVMTVNQLAPEEVGNALITKEGGYIKTIQEAFIAGQKIINEYMSEAKKLTFIEDFDKNMKSINRGKTIRAILYRGAYQIARVGPWALGASIATGLFSHVKGIAGIKDFVQTKAGLAGTEIAEKTAGAKAFIVEKANFIGESLKNISDTVYTKAYNSLPSLQPYFQAPNVLFPSGYVGSPGIPYVPSSGPF